MLDSCVELCSTNGRPFSIVVDSGFKKIIQPIIVGLGDSVAINVNNVKDAVVEKAEVIRQKIADEVNGKRLSLKIYIVTHMGRSFLGINIQFIENKKIVLRSLAVRELFDKHTGENLKNLILDVLNLFDIHLKQIYTCTTDNGTNMVKAVNLCKENVEDENAEEIDSFDRSESARILSDLNEVAKDICSNKKYNFIGIRCAAHTFQLAANESRNTQEYSNAITKARFLVTPRERYN